MKDGKKMANKMIPVSLDESYRIYIASSAEVTPVMEYTDGQRIQKTDPETNLPLWQFDADLCARDGSADFVTIRHASEKALEVARRTEYKVQGTLQYKPWAMKDKVTGQVNSGATLTLIGSLTPATGAVAPAAKSFPPAKD